MGVNPKLQGKVGCKEVGDLSDIFLVTADPIVLLVITAQPLSEHPMCVQCFERSSEHIQQGPS